MKRKDIDENDLKKLTKKEKIEILFSCNLSPDTIDPESEISFENTIKTKLSKFENTKIDDGFYWIEGRIYLSIWSYKKHKFINSINNNETNYNDAKSLYSKDLISETIIVHTHSPTFPTVKGYLENELDIYFSNLKLSLQ